MNFLQNPQIAQLLKQAQ
jgi:hypothetical protein